MLTGLGVKRVQEKRRRDHVDDIAAIDLGVRNPFAVARPHRLFPPLGVRLAIGPERFSGRWIDRRYGAPISGHGVERAVDIARGRPREVARMRPKVISAPDPLKFEVFEVAGVNLIE